MKIDITKGENKHYSLKFQSGHFSGELTEIDESQIDELIKNLNLVRKSDPCNITTIWNPRSQRHERIHVQQ